MNKLFNWLFPVGERLRTVKTILRPERVLERDENGNAVVWEDEIPKYSYVREQADYRVFRFWKRIRVRR